MYDNGRSVLRNMSEDNDEENFVPATAPAPAWEKHTIRVPAATVLALNRRPMTSSSNVNTRRMNFRLVRLDCLSAHCTERITHSPICHCSESLIVW